MRQTGVSVTAVRGGAMTDSEKTSKRDFEYDIFISYNRSRRLNSWIDKDFYPTLCEYLEVDLAKKARVFWDVQDMPVGVPFPPVLEKKLQRSRCMIALLSRGYFQSPWCVAEWNYFSRRSYDGVSRSGLESRIFPIRWHGEIPEQVSYLNPLDFTPYSVVGIAWINGPRYFEFQNKMQSLSKIVADVIEGEPAEQATDRSTIHTRRECAEPQSEDQGVLSWRPPIRSWDPRLNVPRSRSTH